MGIVYGRMSNSSSLVFVIPMGLMSVLSVITSLIGQTYQRRQQKKAGEEQEEQYTAILNRKRSELDEYRRQQQAILLDVNPALPVLLARARDRDPRLWERRPGDDDFLCLRLGLGSVPSSVTVNAPRGEVEELPRLKEAWNLATEFSTVPGVPILANLRERPIGVAGPPQFRDGVVRSLICNLVAHHSPDEVHLLAVCSSAQIEEWQWLKWLPHTHALDTRATRRYLAFDSISAKLVMDGLLDELHKRQNQLHAAQYGGGLLDAPWLVLLVADYWAIRSEPALGVLLTEGSALRTTAIFLVDQPHQVPGGCGATVECLPGNELSYVVAGAGEQALRCQSDFTDPVTCERLARILAPLEVERVRADDDLPSSVRLLDLLGLKSVDQLNAAARWRSKSPGQLLPVPLGMRRGGQPLLLDLNHTAHGPHGLIAGTTGSGKSELLLTMVIALAIAHSPHEVGFVLVDYKGGGTFESLRDLPHTLGVVTDLEGGLAERALVALRSELKRREMLLSQAGVNDIHKYQALGTGEPLPRLFVIIDEFAELASQHPDFMVELVGVAQKGRSLGVHLILATQRPGGAVNANIWANAKFRICLRVETREDSQEMLHRSDAWGLPSGIPGRGFFQVGDNEVFELFQVARVAGEYRVAGQTQILQQEIVIAEVTPTGERRVHYDSGRARRKAAKRADARLEVDMIVEELCKTAQMLGIQKLPSPWPDPLPESVALTSLLRQLGYRTWHALPTLQSVAVSQPTITESTALVCAHCGQPLRVGAHFCSACGRSVEVDAKAEEKPVCPSCGAVGKPKARFCKTCGAQLSPATISCPACGRPLRTTAKFCPWCGQPITIGGRFCKQCGEPLRPGARFCKACGAPVQPMVTPDRATTPTPLPTPAVRPWLHAVLGLLDEPAAQRQGPFVVDLAAQDGHLIVIGAPGSGKDMLLRTLVTSLACTHTPGELNFYLVEFGGQALRAFEALPHSGGLFLPADEERIQRLFRRLLDELDERKRTCNAANVDSLPRYRDLYPDQSPPAIVVLITGFAEFRQVHQEGVMGDVLRLIREGGPYGIHLVLGGDRSGDIPMPISSVVARRLVLRLADPSDYGIILGQLPESAKGKVPPGRGWVGRPPLEFQTASPVQALDDSDQLVVLRELAEEMNRTWTGPRPEPVRTLPDHVALGQVLEDFSSPIYADTLPVLEVPIGIDDRHLRPALIDILNDGPHFLVTAPPQGGKTSALITWALSLAALNSPELVWLVLISPRRHSLRPLADLPHVLDYCTNDVQIREAVARLEQEFEQRMAVYAGASRHDQVLTRTGVLGVEPVIIVLIDDYAQAKDAFSGSRMEDIIKRGGDVGFHIILAGNEGDLTGYDPILSPVKAGKSGVHLRPMDPHSAVFSLRLPVKPGDREMPPGRGVVIRSGITELAQLATPEKTVGSGKQATQDWVREIAARYEQAGIPRAAWSVVREEAPEANEDSDSSL
ncbi:MAG: zinc ribbon domain-containing protein [Anaerolineae bacterium]|nr:zinc ribbon domain-containing protein [Anaerolineae bacterium]